MLQECEYPAPENLDDQKHKELQVQAAMKKEAGEHERKELDNMKKNLDEK